MKKQKHFCRRDQLSPQVDHHEVNRSRVMGSSSVQLIGSVRASVVFLDSFHWNAASITAHYTSECLCERENTLSCSPGENLMHSVELRGLHGKSHLCFQPRHTHCTHGGRIRWRLLLPSAGSLGSRWEQKGKDLTIPNLCLKTTLSHEQTFR